MVDAKKAKKNLEKAEKDIKKVSGSSTFYVDHIPEGDLERSASSDYPYATVNKVSGKNKLKTRSAVERAEYGEGASDASEKPKVPPFSGSLLERRSSLSSEHNQFFSKNGKEGDSVVYSELAFPANENVYQNQSGINTARGAVGGKPSTDNKELVYSELAFPANENVYQNQSGINTARGAVGGKPSTDNKELVYSKLAFPAKQSYEDDKNIYQNQSGINTARGAVGGTPSTKMVTELNNLRLDRDKKTKEQELNEYEDEQVLFSFSELQKQRRVANNPASQHTGPSVQREMQKRKGPKIVDTGRKL